MTKVVELAPAKINLTLEILGRRADGYHELESLIAFASVADRVSLDLSAPPQVTVAGPFAGAIVGANILDRTLALLSAEAPSSAPGRRPPSQGAAGCGRPRRRVGQRGGVAEGHTRGKLRACLES